MQRIDVTGLDEPLFFPDGMEQDAMATAIQQNFPQLFPDPLAELKAIANRPSAAAMLDVEPERVPERAPVASTDFDEDLNVWEKGISEYARLPLAWIGSALSFQKSAVEVTGKGLRGMAEQAASHRASDPAKFLDIGDEASAIFSVGPQHEPEVYNPFDSSVYKAGDSLHEYAAVLDPYIDVTGTPPWAKNLMAGVGTTAPFLVAGAAGPVGWVAGGAFGSWIQRDEFTQDALQYDATPEELKLAGDIGGVVGLTEVLPWNAYFAKIKRIPGGDLFMKKLAGLKPEVRRKLMQGGDIALTGGFEGVQESFQEVMRNITASDWVGYDPERDPLEGLKAAFTGGLSVGSFLATLGHLMGLKGPKRFDDDTDTSPPGPDPDEVLHVSTKIVEGLDQQAKGKDTLPIKQVQKLFRSRGSLPEQETANGILAMPGVVDEKGNVDIQTLQHSLMQQVFPIKPQLGMGLQEYGFRRYGPTRGPTGRYYEQYLFSPAAPRLQELLRDATLRTEQENPYTIEEYNAIMEEVIENDPGRVPYRSPSGNPKIIGVLRQGTSAQNRVGPVVMPNTDMKAQTIRLKNAVEEALDPTKTLRTGTITWRAPFHTYTKRQAHDAFMTDDYLGHTRFFELPGYEGGIFLGEIQTDRSQSFISERGRPLYFDPNVPRQAAREMRGVPEAIANTEAAITELKALQTEVGIALRWPGTREASALVAKYVEVMTDAGAPAGAFLANEQADVKLTQLGERLATDLESFHDIVHKGQTELRRGQEAIASEEKQPLIDKPGEQAMLNWQGMEAVRLAAERGYKSAFIPTAQTAGAIQAWDTKKGNMASMTPEQLKEVFIHPGGQDSGDLLTSGPGARSTRGRKHLKMVKAMFNHYKKQIGKKKLEDALITDPLGYEWLEIPITEDLKNSTTLLYSFPGPIPEMLTRATGRFGKGVKRLFTRLDIHAPTLEDSINEDLDRYNWGIRIYSTLTQLTKLNWHVPGMKQYTEEVRQFWNTKTRWLARADQRLKQIMGLSGDTQTRLFKFALAVTLESERLRRRLTEEEMVAINARVEHDLDAATLAVYNDMDSDFRAALDELYGVLVEERRRAFEDNEVGFRSALAALNQEFNALWNKNFFPLSRFGRKYVTVRTLRDTQLNGIAYRAGAVIDFRTFEGVTAHLQQQAFFDSQKKQAQARRLRVSAGEFQEELLGVMGLPPQAIELLKNSVDLTAEQKTQLADLVTQLSPATSFMRHMIERKGTPGFSMDGIRGYADYFQKFANYIARETHKGKLNDAVNVMQESIKEMDRLGKDHTKRDGIVSHLRRHMEYLYNPGNEAATLRAAAFTFYIGFVVKSAWVNLSQPVLVTLPYLAANYGGVGIGDIRAATGLSRGYMDLAGDKIAAVVAQATHDANQGLLRPRLIEPELAEAISRGVQENFLEESFATEVAGVAEGNLVSRLAPTTKVGRGTRHVGRAAAWLFQQAERLNRRVAFIAAFRLSKAKVARGRPWSELSPAEKEAVFQASREAVESTQYEYARWNRAEFMRGPTKAMIFTFYQYLQQTTFFMTKEKGRGRAILMLLLAAGLMGLPGAEDITDLLDAVFTKFPGLKKRFGLGDDPLTDLRQDLREFLVDISDPDTADMLMYGLGRKYGLGPLHLANLAGAPIPNTDISASLSLGRLLPAGPEYIRDIAYGKSGRDALLDATVNAAGASFGIPLMVLQVLGDNDPDTFKRIERALPTAMKHGVKAHRYWAEGEDYGRLGETVVPFDKHDPVEFAEIMAAGAGFPPTRLTREKDLRWNLAEHQAFWQTRRQIIKQAYVVHRWLRPNEDGLAAAEESLAQFNATIPDRRLKITKRELADFRKSRVGTIRKKEQRKPRSKRLRKEFKRIEGLYPDTDNQ